MSDQPKLSSKLNREVLLQTLAGYREVHRITEAERSARLQALTDTEAREMFNALYMDWKRSGQRAGGDWEALAREKLEHKIKVRQAFEALARRKGLID
jgi:hypothetical protein